MNSAQFARQYWSLIAGVALTITLQVALVARSPIIAKDGIRHINTAEALAADPLLALRSDDTVLGYPALVVLSQKFVAIWGGEGLSSWISGARLVSGVFGVLAAVMLWFLTRQAFDTQTAGVAMAIVAVLPVFRENSSDVLRDTPHLALYLLATWFLIHSLKTGRYFSLALTGAISGLAYWLRVEGLSVAAAGILLLVLGWAETKETRRIHILARLAALALPAAVLVLPSRILMPALGSGGGLVNVPTVGWIERLMAHPVSVIAGMSADLAGDFAHDLRYVLLPVLALGLLAHHRLRGDAVIGRVTLVLFAIHSILLAGFYLVQDYSSQRYLMVPVALSIPWVAAGTVCLAQLPGSVKSDHSAFSYARNHQSRLLVLLVLAFVAGMLPRTLRPLHRQREELVSVAHWLKGKAAKGDCVLSNSPYVPFYAELPGEVVTTGPWGNHFEKERASRCRFAVFDAESSDYDPGWLSTLSDAGRRLDNDIPAVRQGRIVVLELWAEIPSDVSR
jgi:hypothetical protein